ncbi:hypothetical protein CC1G_03621 [Coprinopsis cinerea okayama7|uniref:BTB domain-containing protein n=1 Tax=Coprinopsis cinerea (strain Okayama-7 / 130 / ATCC MYA-4618 / FGSC 9003) TaxID=240176 RepID=A8N1S8_COPC7|nr:hypothetical protein CC1G_03621 [Coprinopsis cinerea okayama7\|eukprot:XP_001828827.1 hypothetical protein CC1G_03621 [Coprinopsis cinerea okayama7\
MNTSTRHAPLPNPGGLHKLQSALVAVSLSDGEAMAAIVEDKEYHLDVVVFQVENVLFKVPKYPFTDSGGVFGTLFSLPTPADSGCGEAEGSSNANPIRLDQTKVDDFRAFLKVLIPKSVPAKYDLSLAEWTSVLALSTKWDFDDMRNFAIESMSPILKEKHVWKVVLGQQYHVRSWLKEGCMHLVTRWSGPSKDEAAQLGLEITVTIYLIREKMLRCRGVYDVAKAVEDEFATELGAEGPSTS